MLFVVGTSNEIVLSFLFLAVPWVLASAVFIVPGMTALLSMSIDSEVDSVPYRDHRYCMMMPGRCCLFVHLGMC